MSAQPLESFCATAEHFTAHCEATSAAVAMLHSITPEFICLSAPNRPAQVSLPDQMPLIALLDVAIAGLFAVALQMDRRMVKLGGKRKRGVYKFFDAADLAAGLSRRDRKNAERLFMLRSRAVFARLVSADFAAVIDDLAMVLIENRTATKATLEQFRLRYELVFKKEAL